MPLSLTQSASGVGAAIQLPASGDFILRFRDPLASAFVIALQAGDGTNFDPAYLDDQSTAISIASASGPRAVRVPGGLSYRMNITTYNDPITMEAFPVGPG